MEQISKFKKEKTPSIIDGKNMCEDFLEDLADEGKVVRGKNAQMLFFFKETPVRAHWVRNQNVMTLTFQKSGECYIDNIIDEIENLFKDNEDTYVEFGRMENILFLSFWKKEIIDKDNNKVYVLAFEEADYKDFSSWIIGVYSTKEKAKERLLEEVKKTYYDMFDDDEEYQEESFQSFLREYLTDEGTRFTDDDIENPCRFYITEMNIE